MIVREQAKMAAKRKSEDYSNVPICKDAFNNGFCPNSKKCKFLHIERTEATKYNICKFDTCNLSITDNSKYCDIHTCPFCNNFKDNKNVVCNNCFKQKIVPLYRKYQHFKSNINTPKFESIEYKCAAGDGELDYMKYLHLSNIPWHLDTCYSAASNGHLDCLKYAHENGSMRGDPRVCIVAAWNGHYECLKYAHERNYPLTSETFNSVRNSECLKYLIDNKCPFTRKTYEYIIQKSMGRRQFLNDIEEYIASGKLQVLDD